VYTATSAFRSAPCGSETPSGRAHARQSGLVVARGAELRNRMDARADAGLRPIRRSSRVAGLVRGCAAGACWMPSSAIARWRMPSAGQSARHASIRPNFALIAKGLSARLGMDPAKRRLLWHARREISETLQQAYGRWEGGGPLKRCRCGREFTRPRWTSAAGQS